MSQGMDRPKVNTEEFGLFFFPWVMLPCGGQLPTLGGFPPMGADRPGRDLLTKGPETATQEPSTPTDILSLHPRPQHHRAGVNPPDRQLPLPNPCLESATVFHRCHSRISQGPSLGWREPGPVAPFAF